MKNLAFFIWKLDTEYLNIGGINMCDVKKYEKIYEEIKCLEPEDTLQLTLEADSEEQREFYQMVGDFLLQKRQKQVIARNLF